MHDVFLAVLLAAGTTCAATWIIIVTIHLARRRSGEHTSLLLPFSLAAAAVIPTGLGVAAGVDVLRDVSSTQIYASWALGALFAGLGVLTWAVSAHDAPLRVRHGAMTVLLLLYWVVGVLSDEWNGRSSAARSLFLVPVAIVLAATVFPRPSTQRAAFAIAGGVFSGASVVYGFMVPLYSHSQATRILPEPFHERLSGFASHPNMLGTVACLTVLMSFSLERRIARVSLGGAALVALLLSESRGAWLGLAAGGLLMLLGKSLARVQARRTKVALTSLVGFGILTWGLARVAADDLSTFGSRTEIWNFVLGSWRDSPYIGFGPSVWDDLVARGLLPSYAGQAHNQWLETLFTTGVVGGIILVLFLLVWARVCFACARNGDWLPMASLAALSVISFFEGTVTLWSLSLSVWVLLAVVHAAPAVERSRLVSSQTRQTRMNVLPSQ